MAKILVVDDSRGIRLAVRGILQALNIEVLEAADGQEAIDKINADGLPDAVLLDWNMPVMDGLECLKTIRANPDWQGCPVIMVTTNNDFSNITEALAAGANEYVMKPFDKEMIFGKLEALGVKINA